MDIDGHHFSINNLFAPSEPNELLAEENSNGQLIAPFWVYKPKQPRVLFLVWYVPTTLDEKKMLSGTVQQVRAFFSFEEQGAEEQQPKQLAFSSLSMAHRCLVEAHNNWSNWKIRVRRSNGSIEEVDLKEYQPNKKGRGFVNQQRPFNVDFYTSLDQRLSAVYRSKSRVKQTFRSRSSSPKREESTSQSERNPSAVVAPATVVPTINKRAPRKSHPLPPSLEDDSEMFAPAVDYQPSLRPAQPPILVLQSNGEQPAQEEVEKQQQQDEDEQALKLQLDLSDQPNPVVESAPLVFTDLHEEAIAVNEFDISADELAKITFSNPDEQQGDKEAETSWVVPTTPEVVTTHDGEEEEPMKPAAAKPKARRGRKKKKEETEKQQEEEETEKAPPKRGRAKAKGAGGEERPKRKYTRRPKPKEESEQSEEEAAAEETTTKKKRGKSVRDASPKKASRRGKK